MCRIDVAGGKLTLLYGINALARQCIDTEEIDAFLHSKLTGCLISTE